MKVLLLSVSKPPKSEVLLQGFGVAMRAMTDDTLDVYTKGNFRFNDMVRGHVNILEKSFIGRGKHVHFNVIRHAGFDDMDMVIWFGSPKAQKPELVQQAQDAGKEVVIFRY